ncbi:hypothetical protein IAT40_004982 [Kwoniella sp. CBS 6097]
MPNLPPHANETNTVLPSASAQQNTRALLRSLEELRDSLSTRVEQLSTAVERLRGQAGQLERALEGDLGSGVGAGAGGETGGNATADQNAIAAILGASVDVGATTGASNTLRGLRDPARTPQRAREIVQAYENRPNPSPLLQPPPPPPPESQARTTASISPSPGPQPRPVPFVRPSAISAEITSLNRPITSEDISALLDRASQPVDRNSTFGSATTASRNNDIINGNDDEASAPAPSIRHHESWLERAQTIEGRIRRLSETSRELRTRASLSLAEGETERSSGLNRLLSRVREDHDRLEAGLRRLDENGISRRSGDVPAINQLSSSSSRARGDDTRTNNVSSTARPRPRSRLGPAIAPRSRSGPGVPRSTGLPPTNTENIARQPSPLIVRSLPASPASTVRPDLDSTAQLLHETSDDQPRAGDLGRPQVETARYDSPLADSLLNQPVTASTMTGEGSGPDSPLTRMRRSAAPPPPPVTHPHIRTAPALGRHETPGRTYRGDDGMTYRGMTVASRMGDQAPTASTSNSRTIAAGLTWPFGDLTAGLPPRTRLPDPDRGNPPRIGQGLRLALDGIEENHPLYAQMQRFQSALDAALSNDASDRASGPDRAARQEAAERFEAGSQLDNAFDSLFSDPANANSTARVVRIDNVQGGTAEGEEVWVVDMTVEPAQAGWESRSGPRALTQPQSQSQPQTREQDIPRPRPVEEAERIRAERLAAGERIRAERQAADERIEQSRAALRRVQELRRELGLLGEENQTLVGEGQSGRSNAMEIEVELEVGMREPGLTPTQGISAASAADDGEIDLMRHLIIDTGSGEDDEEESNSELEVEGSVFEGEGQRHGSRVHNSRQSNATSQNRHHQAQPQAPIHPPKESFDCNIDAWPTLPGPTFNSSSRASEGHHVA